MHIAYKFQTEIEFGTLFTEIHLAVIKIIKATKSKIILGKQILPKYKFFPQIGQTPHTMDR